MPGSQTAPGAVRVPARPSVLPSATRTASAPGLTSIFAAQWLAYAIPYRRFAAALADGGETW
jgi:hypothetical protein